MPRRKTHAEFVAEVKALVGDEYVVLGKYTTSKTHISMKHSSCGHTYNAIPDNFLHGRRCPKCFKCVKKTTSDFIEEVKELVGSEYAVLGEYKTNDTKIKMKHNKCNGEYEVMPRAFLRGDRCPKCFKCVKKTTSDFIEEVKELVGSEYAVLGEYKNNHTKLKIKHNHCCYIYEVRPSDFLKGERCPKCAKRIKKTTSVFMEEVKELVGNEYELTGEYKTALTKIKMKHNKCNHEYEVTPSSFLRGNRCPKCKESKGERKVSDILSDMEIKHIRQYKFKDCRNINMLPFDFAVFDNDGITCMIEYDGKFHYMPFSHAGGEKGLEYRKQNDAIKTKYCADHNIPLIRIPYWEFDNIDAILTKELAKLDVLQEV